MYAQGGSESLLGEAFGHDRDKVVIATKVGYRFPARGGLASRAKPLVRSLARRLRVSRGRLLRPMVSTVSDQDFSPAYITRMLEDSLRRLRTDYVDIYQLHSPPTDFLECGEFIETMERLKREGKVRCWGVACERAEDVLISLRYPEIQSIQIHLSLLHQEALSEAIPGAFTHGAGVIARQVLASGLLSGSEERARADARYLQIAEFSAIARERGQVLPEMALDFVLSQPSVSAALIGLHSPRHLDATLSYLAHLGW